MFCFPFFIGIFAQKQYMDREKVIHLKMLVYEASLKMRPFIRFLKENRVLNSYGRNHVVVMNDLAMGKHSDVSFSEDWHSDLLREIVAIAFIWRDTPEGIVFWHQLHFNWAKKVDSMTEEEKNELNDIVLKIRSKK